MKFILILSSLLFTLKVSSAQNRIKESKHIEIDSLSILFSKMQYEKIKEIKRSPTVKEIYNSNIGNTEIHSIIILNKLADYKIIMFGYLNGKIFQVAALRKIPFHNLRKPEAIFFLQDGSIDCTQINCLDMDMQKIRNDAAMYLTEGNLILKSKTKKGKAQLTSVWQNTG